MRQLISFLDMFPKSALRFVQYVDIAQQKNRTKLSVLRAHRYQNMSRL
jgi:hypothetical protein